jgi:hypothetical protein
MAQAAKQRFFSSTITPDLVGRAILPADTISIVSRRLEGGRRLYLPGRCEKRVAFGSIPPR